MFIPYQKEKIENAICFIAKEHHKKTRQYLSQTALYKYLAFFDFQVLEETGMPALGLKYIAMERGPVPVEIYEKRDNYKTQLFEFKNTEKNKYIIIAKNKPNLDYFSDYEKEKLENLIYIFADRFVNAKIMSDASHEEIKAWQKTWTKKPNSIIDYKDNFCDNLYKKENKELNFSEERFIVAEAIENRLKRKKAC